MAGGLQCAGKVDPVEAQDHVRRRDQLRAVRGRGARGMQRMVGRKAGPGLAVGHHPCADRFGELDAPLPRFRIARGAALQDHRPLGAGEQFGGLAQRRAGRLHGRGRREAGGLRARRGGSDLVFLQFQVRN